MEYYTDLECITGNFLVDADNATCSRTFGGANEPESVLMNWSQDNSAGWLMLNQTSTAGGNCVTQGSIATVFLPLSSCAAFNGYYWTYALNSDMTAVNACRYTDAICTRGGPPYNCQSITLNTCANDGVWSLFQAPASTPLPSSSSTLPSTGTNGGGGGGGGVLPSSSTGTEPTWSSTGQSSSATSAVMSPSALLTCTLALFTLLY